jgi:hypothetical protein
MQWLAGRRDDDQVISAKKSQANVVVKSFMKSEKKGNVIVKLVVGILVAYRALCSFCSGGESEAGSMLVDVIPAEHTVKS